MPTYLDSSDEDEQLFELEEEADATPKTERFVNDVDGILEKLNEFQWPLSAPFSKHQAITSEHPTTVEDVNDDLERELAFYNQASEVTKRAIGYFENSKIPWIRPEDYYTEMVKIDTHMNRIKDQLMFEQKRITLTEQRSCIWPLRRKDIETTARKTWSSNRSKQFFF